MILAAFRIFETRTIYFRIASFVFAAFLILFILIGAMYGSGLIGKAAYASLMGVTVGLFILALLASLGFYAFLRFTRPI